MPTVTVRRLAPFLATIGFAAMLLPAAIAAHSEMVTADPAQGAVVPSPYTGPIVLTFSEQLASGSKADLVDSAGTTVASAVVDPNLKTMTFTLTTPLDAGAWEVRWVSIADDTDLLRDIVKFTVAPSPSSSPSPTPAGTAAASVAPSPTTTPVASTAPTPAPSVAGTPTGSGGDVILPIIMALVILGAGAAYLLRRRDRPADRS